MRTSRFLPPIAASRTPWGELRLKLGAMGSSGWLAMCLGWVGLLGLLGVTALAAPTLASAEDAERVHWVDDGVRIERDAVISAASVQLPMPVHAPRARSSSVGQTAWLRLLASELIVLRASGELAADGGEVPRRPRGSTRSARHLPRSDCDDDAAEARA